MLVRVVRAVLGSVLLLSGLPLLLAGGALWFAMQHQDSGGAYSASLAEISTDGYAVVAPDVDGLLRQDAPFARSGQTTLRITAHAADGPAFVGLAPAADVAQYLAEVPYAQVDGVQLARGPLPVAVVPVAGAEEPAGLPQAQPFWLTSGGTGSLEWTPSELRDRQLALVVMDPAGEAPLTVSLEAQVRPQWLGSTTFGALVLGTVLVLAAVVMLAWPGRAREIVYVVPPAQVPEVAAHLGVPVPPSSVARQRPPSEPHGWPAPSGPGSGPPGPAPEPAEPVEPAPERPDPAPEPAEPRDPLTPESDPQPMEPPDLAAPGIASDPEPAEPAGSRGGPPVWPPAEPQGGTAAPVPTPAPPAEQPAPDPESAPEPSGPLR